MNKHEFNKMPQMREGDYTALLDSLRHFGFDPKYPVVIYEHKILDGWNRYRACTELNISYSEISFFGSNEEAIDFVHRTNVRRNLTINEQAELIGRYYEDIKNAHGGAERFAPSVRSKHLDETPINIELDDDSAASDLVYEIDEIDELNELSSLTVNSSRKKAAHTYGVSESKVNRAAEYVRALDKLPDELKDEARAGKISQAEIVRAANGKPKPKPKGFDKKLMKRKIGAIAFEVEALADTFPETRTVCDNVLNLCRHAQIYIGV